jgi:hypothetical protein
MKSISIPNYDVVYNASRNDFITVNEQIEILVAVLNWVTGWKTKVTFGLYQEFDFISYVPKDIAILA